MGFVKPVRNLLWYSSPSLMPQVDPDIMRPIFEDAIGQLSFYTIEDHLALWKPKREAMIFQYTSQQNASLQPSTRLNGTIYAQKPRKSFGEVDVVSYMAVDTLDPDEQGELFLAIESIANRAGIEKVVTSGLGVYQKDAQRLYEIHGTRDLNQMGDGLGAFIHM